MNISLETNKTVLQVIDTGNIEKSTNQKISETGLQERLSFHQVLGKVHGEGSEQAKLKIEVEFASLEKNALNSFQGVHFPEISSSETPMMSPVVSEPQKQVINPIRLEIEVEEGVPEKNTVSDFRVTHFPTTFSPSAPLFYPGTVEPHAIKQHTVVSHGKSVEPIRLKTEIEDGASEKNVTRDLPGSRHLKPTVFLEKKGADYDASTVVEEEPSGQSKRVLESEVFSVREVKRNLSSRVSVQKTVQETEPADDAIRVDPLAMTGLIPPAISKVQLKPLEVEKKYFHQEQMFSTEVQESPLLNQSKTGVLEKKRQGPILSSIRSPKDAMSFQVQNQVQNQDQNSLLRSAPPNDNEMGENTTKSVKNPFDSKQLAVTSRAIPKSAPETNPERLHPSQTRITLSETEIGKNTERVVLDTVHLKDAQAVNKAGDETTEPFPGGMAETSEAIYRPERPRNFTASNPLYTSIQTPSQDSKQLAVTRKEIPKSASETNPERLHPSQTRITLSEAEIGKNTERVVLDTFHPKDASDVNKAGGEKTEPFREEIAETFEAISNFQIHRSFTGSNPVYTAIQASSAENNPHQERLITNDKSVLMLDETNFQNGSIDRSVDNMTGHLDGRTLSDFELIDVPFPPDLKAVLLQDNLMKRENISMPVVRPLEPVFVLNDPLLREVQVEGVEEMTDFEGRGVFPSIENAPKRPMAKALPVSLSSNSSITENNALEIEEGSKVFPDRPEVFSAIDLSSSVGEKDIQKAISSENKFQDLKAVLPNEESILQQVSDRIRLWKPGKETSVRIQLEPENLGSLQIEMKVEDNRVIARIITEDVSIKGLIERNQDILRQGLEGQGFKIERFSVDVGGMARSFDQRGGESFSQQKAQEFYAPKENDTPSQSQTFRRTVKGSGVLNLYA